MSGHKKINTLRNQFDQRLAADPVAAARFEEESRALHDALALSDLREARGFIRIVRIESPPVGP